MDCAYSSNLDVQQTLAVFYADILKFHKQAYKFVRRSGKILRVYQRRIGLTLYRLEGILPYFMGAVPTAVRQHYRGSESP
jgi:hypothetical protein